MRARKALWENPTQKVAPHNELNDLQAHAGKSLNSTSVYSFKFGIVFYARSTLHPSVFWEDGCYCWGIRGIGRATAFELARLGANICIIARNEVVLREVKEELEKNRANREQGMHCISADATIEGQLRPSLESFVDENGCDISLIVSEGLYPTISKMIPSRILRMLWTSIIWVR